MAVCTSRIGGTSVESYRAEPVLEQVAIGESSHSEAARPGVKACSRRVAALPSGAPDRPARTPSRIYG